MAKILLEYDADINDLTSKLKKVEVANTSVDNSAKKTGKTLNQSYLDAAKAAGTVQRETTKLNSTLKETSTAAGSAASVFSNVAKGIGAAFTIDKIIQFADASIKAFTDSQAKTEKLKFTLESITKDGGAFDRLIKQSELLQDTLQIFDAEDIQGIQAAQAQYGLTARQIEKLTPLILELASAQRIDLTSATDIALKAIEGQTRGLKSAGAAFDDTGSSVGNFNQLVESLAKLEGSAAAELGTVNGQLKAQEVAAGNLQEQIGAKLTPAFVELKNAILGVGLTLTNLVFPTDAITTAQKEINDLQKTLSERYATTPTDELKKQVESVNAEILKLKSSVKDVPFGFDRGEKIQDIINQVSFLNKSQLALRQIILQRGVDEKRTQEDAIRNSKLEALAKEDLTKLSKKQLADAIANLKLRSDSESKDVQDQIERRKKAIEDILKLEKQLADKLAAQREADKEKAKEQKDRDDKKAIEDEKKYLEDIAKLQETREKNKTPEIVKAIESDTEATINALKQRFIAVGDFSEDAQNKLNDAINEVVLSGLQLQLAETKAAGESTVEIEKQINDLIISSNQEKNDRLLESDQQAAEERQQLIQDIVDVSLSLEGELFNLQMAQSEARIQQLEAEKEAQLSAFDEQLSALEALNEAGAYSDRVYEAKKKDLLAQRVAAEKKADAEIRKLKREQAAADKAQAIFEIIINTAVAVSQLLANPFLAAAAGIAGALQLATVIAQPLPKFFKGTKFVERGNNKAGRDTIPAMLNEGERVVTTSNNQKYWKEYEALDSGRFKQFVDKFHVAPALLEMKRKNETKQRGDMASAVGKSLFNSFAGMTAYDAERIRKKGMTINNSKELATLIAETIVEKLPKSYGKW